MNREEAKTEYIHLTKNQVQTTLRGLSLLLERHYGNYDVDLPEKILAIVQVFTEVRSNFKWCHDCRNDFYMRWSSTECGCEESKKKGEEE